VRGALVADDTAAMSDCLRGLGAGVRWEGTTVTVDGVAGRVEADGVRLDARLSGTTSRFVLPLLALGPGSKRLDGAEPLRRRPMGPVLDALRELGASVDGDALPVTVRGPVRGGAVRVRADLSSQFVSGLLLAGPAMPDGLAVTLEGDLVAAPFVTMTVAVMREFGAEVDDLRVAPGAYTARDFDVEPDASAASYFWAAAALTGRDVRVGGFDGPSLQGDIRFRSVLASMGAPGPLHGIDVDLGDMPDMAQTFAVVAACAEGPSRVRGVSVIRGHETDRITAVVEELRRVGVGATETDDGFVVEPAPLRPATVRTYEDHRMAMSFAVLGLLEPGITVEDPDVVAKTFPGFWEQLARLRP
jgi:3-phosphoshikimate 1-carboxyvinyltransferase